VADDDDDEEVVEFELFFSELESEFFMSCVTTFSFNESDTSSTSFSCTENILINIKIFVLFIYNIQILGVEFICES
jgi:hypothetical protein